jgi:hypothetical protein
MDNIVSSAGVRIKVLKKAVLLTLSLLLFLSFCQKSPESPDKPEPEPAKYYDLEVTYIRTEILYPKHINFPIGPGLYLIHEAGTKRIASITLTKVNEYKFTGEFSQIFNNGSENYYALHTMDSARWDGSDGSSIVGDKFFIKVKQTGFEKELKDIRKNTF